MITVKEAGRNNSLIRVLDDAIHELWKTTGKRPEVCVVDELTHAAVHAYWYELGRFSYGPLWNGIGKQVEWDGIPVFSTRQAVALVPSIHVTLFRSIDEVVEQLETRWDVIDELVPPGLVEQPGEQAWPWCPGCESYHHPDNPTCRLKQACCPYHKDGGSLTESCIHF